MERRYPKPSQELDVEQGSPRTPSEQIRFYQVLASQTPKLDYAPFLISIEPLLISLENALPNSQPFGRYIVPDNHTFQ